MMPQRLRAFQQPLVAGLCLSLVLFAGQVIADETKDTGVKMPLEDLQKFTRVIDQIKTNYVKEVTDKELFDNAIRGMLEGLDPHSAYLDDESYSDLKVSTSGKFGGLGIEVTMEDGFLKVVSPIDDTPAQKAGIKAGDLIIRLDDTPVNGLSLRDAVNMMRGETGSPINLTIVRKGAEKPIVFKVMRDVIKVQSVKAEMLEPGYPYVRITHFQSKTDTDVADALKKLQASSKVPFKGMVLDLRNNPGGVLDAAVGVSNNFLDYKKTIFDHTIVFTKGRTKSSDDRERASGTDMLHGIPMVILVNEGSASASEIVAGALQDQKRAIIMGTTTFGKGSVQTVLPLTDNSGLKLTTAFYYTPSGRSIQAEGIKPDIVVNDYEIKLKDNTDLDSVKEADLSRHFTQKDEKAPVTDAKKEKVTNWYTKDFVRAEALNVLKGLQVGSREVH